MPLAKNLFFILLTLINTYSLTSNDSLFDQKIRCESRFFDQYYSRFETVLRIRENVLSSYPKDMSCVIKRDPETSNLYTENVFDLCERFHNKMFDGIELLMHEHKDYAKRDFFDQYVIAKMIEFKESQKAENVANRGVLSFVSRIQSSEKLARLVRLFEELL